MSESHVVTSPKAPFHSKSGRLVVHQVPAAHDNLVWVVANEETREAFVVDGPDAEGALKLCGQHGLRLSAVFNTHIHGDHIGINHDLARLALLPKLRVFGSRKTAGSIPGLTDPLDDGDEVELCGVKGKVMLTEGHINGHISLFIDGLLFCGDTLFAGGCGYLFDGPPAAMHKSLTLLRGLPEDTLVCCAHEYTQDNMRFAYSVDPDNAALKERIREVFQVRSLGESTVPSTIGLERATNPFLRFDDPSLRSHVQAAMPEHNLASDGDFFAATRALKDRKDYKSLSDRDLPI